MQAEAGDAGQAEALKRIGEANTPRVLRVDLSRLQLTSLPPALFELRYIREVDLSNNEITKLPDEISRLQYLQELSVAHNDLSTLPSTLAELPNLRRLDASYNHITVLPDSCCDLRALEYLGVEYNQLTSVPALLSRLRTLQALNLSHNLLTAIPAMDLAVLQRLNLSDNRLPFLYAGQLSLPALQYLNLARNYLRALSLGSSAFPRLTELYLHGNPDLMLPNDLLGPAEPDVASGTSEPKPPSEILSYYSATRAASRPLNEAKLIFVGQGGVGKTSLVKSLVTASFDQNEPNTEGIQISDWSCLLSSGRTTVHIWDFGGQEMMHSTHRFFLTDRSLYVLVLNRRQGGSDEQADYWLRLVRTFAGERAPVIIVLNRQVREPFDVDRCAWTEKYPDNITVFVSTDCQDHASIAHLKHCIIEQLEKVESIKAKFPEKWFLIKNELSRMNDDYLTLERYRALCAAYGEPASGSQSSLAGFLHDLGIALNYKNDPRLRLYVLNPKWVTDGIYTLLHAFARNNGLFTFTEAVAALDDHGYSPEATMFIVALMERFELGFSFGEPPSKVLIPQLLSEQQPEATRGFDPGSCLNYGYKYSIVPEGLLPRFIVRTHHLSGPELRWKHGVILVHEPSGCRALVRSLPADHEVRIHINGPEAERRDLLAIVRYNFDVIHRDYGSLPDDLLYAPGAMRHPVTLRGVRARLKKGRTTIDIDIDEDEIIESPIAPLTEPLNTPPPLRLFLSYAHADEEYIERLRKELKLLERNGSIRPWYDRALTAGELWEPRILQELESAEVVVIQLSPDFLASDFCVLKELAAAIERKRAGRAELVAYVLRECGWKQVRELGNFQMLPKDLKPVRSWRDPDRFWRAIAEGVASSVEKLRRAKTNHAEATGAA
jgi:internalin A